MWATRRPDAQHVLPPPCRCADQRTPGRGGAAGPSVLLRQRRLPGEDIRRAGSRADDATGPTDGPVKGDIGGDRTGSPTSSGWPSAGTACCGLSAPCLTCSSAPQILGADDFTPRTCLRHCQSPTGSAEVKGPRPELKRRHALRVGSGPWVRGEPRAACHSASASLSTIR